MSRKYDDNQTLQQKIMRGANVLADNVASTLAQEAEMSSYKRKEGTPSSPRMA